MVKKGFIHSNTIETARKVEAALRGPGKGLKVGKLAGLLQMSVATVSNVVSYSPRICEDDDGRLFYIDWMTTR